MGKALKLCDLGLARIQHRERVSMTCEGTFAYMPPEVMLRDRVVSYDGKKWDVYSTAVVLLAMWTCQHPYQDLTPPQIIAGVPDSLRLTQELTRIPMERSRTRKDSDRTSQRGSRVLFWV